MIIKRLKKDKSLIPKFNGNRDLPESDQVKVHFKNFPTNPQKQSYKAYTFTEGGAIGVSYPNDTMMLSTHIERIENLSYGEGAGKIDTGQKLAQACESELSGLITEIRDYLVNDEETEELTEGES